jgi:DNA-binding NtrC family response regulator
VYYSTIYNKDVTCSNSFSILLVDDEIDILSVIKLRLEEHGFNICSFTKASIALKYYKISSKIIN